MDKGRFLIILGASCILFSLFIIIDPEPIRGKIGLDKITVLNKVRNKFIVEKNIELILVGDVMLGRTVMTTSLDKNDPTYPFLKVADKLKSTNFTAANLETPVIFDCPRRIEGLIFCADPKMVEGLTYAGIDVVNLANNHTLNYGQNGLSQTKEILEKNQITWVDNQSLKIIERGGVKFGFIGFERSQQSSPTLSLDEEKLIRESDAKVDVLIISIHWGVEYQDMALHGVSELARRLVELGVDVIHGHHPHWVQNIEYIHDPVSLRTVPIYYSLGNFVFDQMWSEKTKQGLAVKLTFDPSGRFIKDEKLPVYIREVGQPEWVY